MDHHLFGLSSYDPPCGDSLTGFIEGLQACEPAAFASRFVEAIAIKLLWMKKTFYICALNEKNIEILFSITYN